MRRKEPEGAISGGMVRLWRRGEGLTLKSVALALGISACHLYQIEVGARPLTARRRKRLIRIIRGR